jgi:hypothetical protein
MQLLLGLTHMAMPANTLTLLCNFPDYNRHATKDDKH